MQCVQVAVAVGKTEQLPMVFKLPYLKTTYAMAVCGIHKYSMLGFGDLVIPGLFLCFLLKYAVSE